MPCGGLDFSPVSGLFPNNTDPLMAELEMKGRVDEGISIFTVQSVNLKGETLGHLRRWNTFPAFQITFSTQSQSFLQGTRVPREACRELLLMIEVSFLNFP